MDRKHRETGVTPRGRKHVDKKNPGPRSSPDGLQLPLDHGMLEAAKEMYRDNRGELWHHITATGLLAGSGGVELEANLISLFAQMDEISLTSLDHAFGVNGREAWAIAQAEPIFSFWCLDCKEQLPLKDPRDLRRLKRAVETISNSSVGDLVSTDLLCGRCTEFRLEYHSEKCRTTRLTRQARAAQLKKMGAKYREEPEWQIRRTRALIRAGYRCQTCGCADATLDVHHNTYAHYGDESPQDLVVLCRSCHQRIHGIGQDAL
jgi:5-methylcytosine-specific restriction endonuclease McrA